MNQQKVQFTDTQIDKLRMEYSTLERMTVEKGAELGAILDKLPDSALVQIARKQVKFVSLLAMNRIIKRNLRCGEPTMGPDDLIRPCIMYAGHTCWCNTGR